MDRTAPPDNSARIQGKARAIWPRILLTGLYLLVGFWLLLTENRWGSRDSGVLWLLFWPGVLSGGFAIKFFLDAFFNAWENFSNRRNKNWENEPVIRPLLTGLVLALVCLVLWVGFVLIFGGAS